LLPSIDGWTKVLPIGESGQRSTLKFVARGLFVPILLFDFGVRSACFPEKDPRQDRAEDHDYDKTETEDDRDGQIHG